MTGCRENIYLYRDDHKESEYISIDVDVENRVIYFLCFCLPYQQLSDVYNCQYSVDEINQLLKCYDQQKDYCSENICLQLMWDDIEIRGKMNKLCDLTSCNVDCDSIGSLYFSKSFRDNVFYKLQQAIKEVVKNDQKE